jgi:predicted secreted protein
MRTSIAVATFFCLWFITLFTVLPFFAKTQGEAGDVVPGTPESAPHRINPMRVFLVNTAVTGIVFAIIYAVVANFDLMGMYLAFSGIGK